MTPRSATTRIFLVRNSLDPLGSTTYHNQCHIFIRPTSVRQSQTSEHARPGPLRPSHHLRLWRFTMRTPFFPFMKPTTSLKFGIDRCFVALRLCALPLCAPWLLGCCGTSGVAPCSPSPLSLNAYVSSTNTSHDAQLEACVNKAGASECWTDLQKMRTASTGSADPTPIEQEFAKCLNNKKQLDAVESCFTSCPPGKNNPNEHAASGTPSVSSNHHANTTEMDAFLGTSPPQTRHLTSTDAAALQEVIRRYESKSKFNENDARQLFQWAGVAGGPKRESRVRSQADYDPPRDPAARMTWDAAMRIIGSRADELVPFANQWTGWQPSEGMKDLITIEAMYEVRYGAEYCVAIYNAQH